MPRTRARLERATAEAEAEAWLDSLDPKTTPADRIEDLRAVASAGERVATAEKDVAAAVVKARKNGRSWAMIGRSLGISAQAAHQRYGTVERKPATKKAPAKKVAAKKAAARLPSRARVHA